jgi:ADP-ribose pyrophosphatase YjhB (NUDIX family)
VPVGDNRLRDCCPQCGAIHYVNPRPVVGTVPRWQSGELLLCRRAIEPRRGYWTLPAGFLEVGETTAAGALRETEEEAGARVTLGPLFTLIDVPHVEQVHIFFLAEMLDLNFSAGEESLDVKLFRPDELPWDELAFDTVRTTLTLYLDDLQRGSFGTYTRELLYPQAHRPAA